jgi:hypothetical protein
LHFASANVLRSSQGFRLRNPAHSKSNNEWCSYFHNLIWVSSFGYRAFALYASPRQSSEFSLIPPPSHST